MGMSPNLLYLQLLYHMWWFIRKALKKHATFVCFHQGITWALTHSHIFMVNKKNNIILPLTDPFGILKKKLFPPLFRSFRRPFPEILGMGKN
jgi:hypothetical protein